ncbi:hypothetical protein MMC10_002341 [Thelotrema lepadinum]|nr:hypothetical protein [Thelotrema lepadinum]
MKKFGLPSGYYEDHAYEKLEGPRNRSKISSLFHREPPVFNKETWCRNCAYWISPNPAPAVHSKYWKTDLVVAGDCPICEEQLKLGILLIHPWIRDFEKVKGIKSAELINAERATLAYWNDRSVRRMAKLEKHVKSLERHQKVLEMNEDEFVAQCLTVEHRWNKLEQDRRAVNYGRQLFNKTWCPHITNDSLDEFDYVHFRVAKGLITQPATECEYKLPYPKFRNETERLGASKMNARDFNDRCGELTGIWEELEADRREIEMKSKGKITT